MDPKKLPPLTDEEIEAFEVACKENPYYIEEYKRDFLRLCAQAKRYPAMVEALDACKAWMDATDEEPQDMEKCYVTNMKMRVAVRAALKGETPQ